MSKDAPDLDKFLDEALAAVAKLRAELDAARAEAARWKQNSEDHAGDCIRLTGDVRRLRESIIGAIQDLNVSLEDGIDKPLTVQPVLEARKKLRAALTTFCSDSTKKEEG